MGVIVRNRKLPLKTRLRILNRYILSVVTYCCVTWITNAAYEASLEVTEMWFMWRMLRIPWTDYETNVNVLNRAGTSKRHFNDDNRDKTITVLGHDVRKQQLENLVLTGTFDGKKGPGIDQEPVISLVCRNGLILQAMRTPSSMQVQRERETARHERQRRRRRPAAVPPDRRCSALG